MQQFWQALRRIEPVFQTLSRALSRQVQPRALLLGRLRSRRLALQRPARPPAQGQVDRDAYDEEVISLGFWPGDPWTGAAEAMFYSYTVPEPAGLPDQRVRPTRAAFSATMKEFVLPYEDVRRSADPAAAILEFAQSTYDAGATLAGWDKTALE